MSALSKPYFFAFDTKSKPGKIIAECIRFQTIELESEGFDHTTFTLLGADYDDDHRIRQAFGCAHQFIVGNKLKPE